MSKVEASVLISGAYQTPRETYGKGLRHVGFQTTEIHEKSHPPHYLKEIVKQHDALLIQGGADINPARYGQTQSPHTKGINHTRDEVESQLIQHAMEQGKPILGVCRGAQLVAVELFNIHKDSLGNVSILTQDIPTMVKSDIYHGQPASYDILHTNRHPIQTKNNTLARSIYGQNIDMTTAHHQAVNKEPLAKIPGVTVSAFAPDGLTEIFEATQYDQWLMGVQGHPEVAADLYIPLFTAFHEATVENKSRKVEYVVFDMGEMERSA